MRRLMNVRWQTRHHLQWHKVENRQSYLFIFTLYKQPKKLDARKTIKIMQHLAKVYQRKVDVNKGLLWLYWRCQFRTFNAILNSLRFNFLVLPELINGSLPFKISPICWKELCLSNCQRHNKTVVKRWKKNPNKYDVLHIVLFANYA